MFWFFEDDDGLKIAGAKDPDQTFFFKGKDPGLYTMQRTMVKGGGVAAWGKMKVKGENCSKNVEKCLKTDLLAYQFLNVFFEVHNIYACKV